MSGRKLETRCSNSDPRCPIPDNGFGAANNSKINVSANQKREKLAKLKIKENKNLFQERERERERSAFEDRAVVRDAETLLAKLKTLF